MIDEKQSKKYWFIKKGYGGLGFGAFLGYPNTWQGFSFWIFILVCISTFPQWVERVSQIKGIGIGVFLGIIFLVWFPVTAIKTKYILDENEKK